ncbi:MAG: hypothetical protein WCF19_02605 [Chlamydiales bacterium]
MYNLIALFLLIFAYADAKQCIFLPPAGWEIAQLKNRSPHIEIGFIGKGTGEFRPSINLAVEEIDGSLKDYVKAVKNLQSADPTIQWRDLGKLSMKSGQGRLTEMTNSSPWGDLKILQAFFVEEGKAYILTAAVLKEDFLKFQSQLLQSFRSLAIIEDLWTPIAGEKEKREFQALFTSLGHSAEKDLEWETVQAQIGSKRELGPYWQFLALQEGHAKIYGTK